MDLKVINGNNIDILKTYPDNYFDAVVTDPPYGLGKEPNAEELMKDWIEHGYHEISGSGFMGKEWDAFVPQPIFWKEVYRVLKPGGHILSFFGTRTYDWGVMSMRFAGFEVRDCIQWLYGSGFPKSHNISKAFNKIDGVEFEGKPAEGVGFMKPDSEDWNVTKNQLIQKGESSENAKKWDGWGTALKPANEPIVLARKPLEKGLSIAENILKWGVGGINIDASRISTEDKTQRTNNGVEWGNRKDEYYEDREKEVFGSPLGRFPANIILTHHEDCVCKGTKKVKAIKGGSGGSESMNEQGYGFKKIQNGANAGGLADADGNETIEDWDCHEDCPIRILDEQSGVSKSSKSAKLYINDTEGRSVKNGASGFRDPNSTYGDKGGASRFFYVAKASKAERNKGLDDFEEKPLAFSNQAKAELKRGNLEFNGNGITGEGIVGHGNKVNMLKNFHPTVKPINLMQYLVKMITPPNGIVLDPFCGSGTTGVACKIDGFQFIGLEQDPQYTKIAEARISNYKDDSKKNKEDNNQKDQLSLF
jgi:site-specific DNA-methyltransferase (adenine-specific)